MHELNLSHPTYTMQHSGRHGFGMPMHNPYPLMQGFCHSCCHPIMKCCCGIRECRKEAKELMVSPKSQIKTNAAIDDSSVQMLSPRDRKLVDSTKPSTELRQLGQDEAFIGGGCCVHLSVEYMPEPVSGTNSGYVRVSVTDSEETELQWMKTVKPGSGYRIKEAIISTNPGAILRVTVNNVIARVRWCECFSC